MPHYRNGVQAMEGDLVFGKTYNLGGRFIVGTMMEIIPGPENCNCRVAFAEVLARPDATVGDSGISYQSHDKTGFWRVIKPGFDYGETREFDLVSRADGQKIAAPKLAAGTTTA